MPPGSGGRLSWQLLHGVFLLILNPFVRGMRFVLSEGKVPCEQPTCSAFADMRGDPRPAACTVCDAAAASFPWPDNHVLELISQNTCSCLKPQWAPPGLEPEAFIPAGNPVLQVPNQQTNQKGRREEEGRQHWGVPPAAPIPGEGTHRLCLARCYSCGVGSCNMVLF